MFISAENFRTRNKICNVLIWGNLNAQPDSKDEHVASNILHLEMLKHYFCLFFF